MPPDQDDAALLWEIVTVHVPPLIEHLRIILPDAPPGDTS